MGLFVNQQDGRSELQKRIANDLREKAQKTTFDKDAMMDGVEDAKYLEGTKKTTTLAWAWIVIIIVALLILIMFISQG